MPALYPAGAERTTVQLLGDLAARGLGVTLFLINHAGFLLSQVPANVRIVGALPKSTQMTAGTAPRIMRSLMKCAREADVVVGGLELHPTYFAYFCGRMINRPVVGWVHTSMRKHLQLFRRRHLIYTRLIYPRLERVVVLSQAAADSLNAVVKIRPERLAIIPSYLDWASLTVNASGPIQAWANEILAKPTIVSVGRLVQVKGMDVLIKAHARVRAAGLDHNLLIMGEGPLRLELENIARSLNVQGSVFLPGFVPNPFSILKAAGIFVLASRYEGLPMALLEALGVGAAAIATDCEGGSPEILDNGKYGLMVKPEDDSGLATAITKVLTDDALRASLRRAGPLRAQSFIPETSLSRWERLLSDAAEGYRRE